jgi:hypothetical protein
LLRLGVLGPQSGHFGPPQQYSTALQACPHGTLTGNLMVLQHTQSLFFEEPSLQDLHDWPFNDSKRANATMIKKIAFILRFSLYFLLFN